MDGIDGDIATAAGWLVEHWREPFDDRLRFPASLLKARRYQKATVDLQRIRNGKPAHHESVGMAVPCVQPGDHLATVSVRVFNGGRVHGYLPGSDWPDFAWPPEEAERLRRKREPVESR